ncbi:hypothetical protein A2U01_0070273, partial [Trifolium medium]|nr:hypothetical protein [Trifolium medium]
HLAADVGLLNTPQNLATDVRLLNTPPRAQRYRA